MWKFGSDLAFYARVLWLRWGGSHQKEEEEDKVPHNEARVTKAFYVDREEGKDVTEWMRQNYRLHRKGMSGSGESRNIPLTLHQKNKADYYLCIEYRQFRSLYRVHYLVSDGSILFPPYENNECDPNLPQPVAAFVLPLENRDKEGCDRSWLNISGEFLQEAGPRRNFYADLPPLKHCFRFWLKDLKVRGFVKLRFLMASGEKRELSLLH